MRLGQEGGSAVLGACRRRECWDRRIDVIEEHRGYMVAGEKCIEIKL